MITAMRAAGMRGNAEQERVVVDVMMPKFRKLLEEANRLPEPLRRLRAAHDSRLSGREYSVLVCGARGLTAEQTARCLGISYNTAKSHRFGVYRKLGTSSMIQSIRYALRNGIITQDQIEGVS